MIRLRTKPKVPKILESKEVADVMDKVKAKVTTKEEISSADFPNRYWLADKVRLVLWEYQHGKCCYCERKRDPKGEPNIEHFRPKTKADDVKPGYWWLAYDWNNLFFSCQRCNKKKSKRFPLLKGKRVRNPKGNISKEKPILPHPVDENPEEIIDFRWQFSPIEIAIPIGKDRERRGADTIKILGLDDGNLAEERGRFLLTLRAIVVKMHYAEHLVKNAAIKKIAKDIKRETKADNLFAGFRRAFFRAAGLEEYIASD